jgi:hypothetical protein
VFPLSFLLGSYDIIGADVTWGIVKAVNAQLVPVYAYDPRFPNVLYIRDNESEKGNVYLQSAPGNGRPSGIYQFNRLKGMSRSLRRVGGGY